MKKRVIYSRQADEYLRTLPIRIQAQFVRAKEHLAAEGRLAAPFGEVVSGYTNLFAIRITHGKNVRFFYAYADGDIVWILSGYEKKRQTIPRQELEKALRIKKELGIQ